MQYRAEIDGLRALAVLPVIGFHAGLEAFAGGFVGVDVFFVISGYLITGIIVRAHEDDRFSYADFYARRARRILPALFLVVGCCVPFAWALLLPADYELFARSIVATVLFLSNVLFLSETGYFAPDADAQPLLHTWSLAVEEQFYLLYPLLLVLLLRRGRREAAVAIGVISLASLALTEWGWRNQPSANFYLLHFRVWELGLGACCALLALRVPRPWNEVGAFAGIAAILTSVLLLDGQTPFPSLYALLPVLGTAAIIACADETSAAGRLLGSRALVQIGVLSYGAYLWHQPVFAFLRAGLGGALDWGMALAATLLAFLLAWIGFVLVERPFRHPGAGPAWLDGQRRPVLLFGALVLLALGATGWLRGGNVERYAPEQHALVTALNNPALGNYVAERFDARRSAPFEEGRRVLIIGDSFAQDLVNVLHEAEVLGDTTLSTHYIHTRCGTVWTDADVDPFVALSERTRCNAAGRFDDPRLMERIGEAELIVLAASWQAWQLDYLPETLDRLGARSSAEIVVVGRKNFGRVEAASLLALPVDERPAYRVELTEKHRLVDARMRSEPDLPFLDVTQAVCGETERCPQFTTAGLLISYDGHHLTRAGAAFVAERLRTRSARFAEIFRIGVGAE